MSFSIQAGLPDFVIQHSGGPARLCHSALSIIDSLTELLDAQYTILKDTDRIAYFLAQQQGTFTRKDYLKVFKKISPATASRDLKKGIESGILEKEGD